MSQVDTILSLMRPELTDAQLGKLQTVLRAVLKIQKDLPALPEILKRFEASKRLLGIKETSITQYSLEVSTMAKHVDKPLHELTSADIRDYLSDYKERKEISMVTVQNKLRFLSSFNVLSHTAGGTAQLQNITNASDTHTYTSHWIGIHK